MAQPCSQSEKIGSMDARIKNLTDVVPSLNDTVIRLDESVKILAKNSESMTTAINGLIKFQSETIGEIKATQRIKANQRWLIGLLIACFFSIAGLTLDIIIRKNTPQHEIDNKQKSEHIRPDNRLSKSDGRYTGSARQPRF